MAPRAEACDECTQNCLCMHQRNKNPSPVATTFFKVMFGDDYSNYMILPPNFARTLQNMVGKVIQLEDSVGEKWPVKFTRVDGLLALEDGWNKFSSDHRLKLGDFLVFYYVMRSKFVVSIYGPSGCPEIRHIGFSRNQAKRTKREGIIIADDHGPLNDESSPSSQSKRYVDGANERSDDHGLLNVNIDGHNRSDEPSKSKRSLDGANERSDDHGPLNLNINDHDCSDKSSSKSKRSVDRTNDRSDDHGPLNVNINGHNRSHESSSKSKHSVDEANKCSDDHGQLNMNINGHNRSHESSSKSKHSVDEANKRSDDHESSSNSKRSGDEANKRADDHDLMNVNINSHDRSDESLSQSKRLVEGANEPAEITHSEDNVRKTKRIRTEDRSPSNLNSTNPNHQYASSSQDQPSVSHKERSQRSEPLIKNTTPDNVFKTPKAMELFCLVDRDTINNEDDSRRSCLHDLSIFEIHQQKSDGGREKDVPARADEVETPINGKEKMVQKHIEEPVKRPNEQTVKPSEAMCQNSIKRRLRNASVPTKNTAKVKKELVGRSNKDMMFEAARVTRAKAAKKEPVCISDIDAPRSRLRNVSATPRNFQKPMAKSMKEIKKEPIMIPCLDDAIGKYSVLQPKDTKMGRHSFVKKEDDILLPVKPEPVDHDETIPPGAANMSFSAVMSSYQYLELADWVKLPSQVILLRNGADTWPVLFRVELDLKALTYGWESFAREKGILPGDECEFVQESGPDGPRSFAVFRVQVTRK